MKLVRLDTKSYEEVPDEQVGQAFAAGTHGFASPDEQVPVRAPDGQIGTVAAKDYEQAAKAGAQIVSHQEYRQADLEARHGGLGGTLAATAEGAARGLTVGLSDPIAISIAKLFGKGEETRTHLEEEKEAHPIASTVGEIGGAALPAFASGGATAPEEAGALGLSKGQLLLKAIGAPARAVTGAGEFAGGLAEQAAKSILETPSAGSAVHRILTHAVRGLSTGFVEGGLFGAGNELSESALGDHELNAEKMAAAIGHGALYGAMTGGVGAGGLQAAKEAAGPILSRVAPYLERQADRQAARAFDVKLGLAQKAEARAGGVEELGATARKYDIIPSDPIEAAKLNPESLLEKTRAAKDQVGKQIGAILEGSSATVNASEVLDPIDQRIAKLEGTGAGKATARQLQGFRDDLAEALGFVDEQKVKRTDAQIQAYLEAHPEVMRSPQWAEALQQNTMPDEVLYRLEPAKDATVPLKRLVDERRALQKSLQWPAQEAGGASHELRAFSGELNELEQTKINEAAHTMGEAQGDALRAANKDMQRLYLLETAAERRVAAHTALRAVSPTSYLAGIGGAVLGHGSPMGLLTGMAATAGHQIVHDRGNAVAAAMLGKIAKLDLIARASKAVDTQIDEAVDKFVTAPKGSGIKVRLRHFSSPPDEDVRARHQAALQTMGAAAATFGMQHVEQAIPGLADHAPNTAGALARTVQAGAAYIQKTAPPTPPLPSVLGRAGGPTDLEASQHLRIMGAVEDPVGVLLRGLESGKIHQDEIDAIRATKPRLYQQMQQRLLERTLIHRDALDYSKVQVLSALTGAPLDPSFGPMGAWLQQTIRTPSKAPTSMAEQPAQATKRVLRGFSDQTQLSTGIIGGRS